MPTILPISHTPAPPVCLPRPARTRSYHPPCDRRAARLAWALTRIEATRGWRRLVAWGLACGI
ncbi:MAG: hypothetical protein ACJ8CR_09165 [Roseiflexaceae bacterium]